MKMMVMMVMMMMRRMRMMFMTDEYSLRGMSIMMEDQLKLANQN